MRPVLRAAPQPEQLSFLEAIPAPKPSTITRSDAHYLRKCEAIIKSVSLDLDDSARRA